MIFITLIRAFQGKRIPLIAVSSCARFIIMHDVTGTNKPLCMPESFHFIHIQYAESIVKNKSMSVDVRKIPELAGTCMCDIVYVVYYITMTNLFHVQRSTSK